MNNKFTVAREPLLDASDYGTVPIRFTVGAVLDVTGDAACGFTITERTVHDPYEKDYDLDDGEGPDRWARRFDVSRWMSFAIRRDARRVGGAVVALDTPGVDMLECRSDLAVLWDIRVALEVRGIGIGSALFRAAQSWAIEMGCYELKIETQNVNVPACRFYERMGCSIRSIHPGAYPELPDEVQIIWRKWLEKP